MQKKLFVTGIGTGVGKTICSAILVQYFQADYWKPIQSGDLHDTDSMKVKKLTDTSIHCHEESFRLKLAASPHQSAAEEGISIRVHDIHSPKTTRPLIVEGAGGLMVPLSPNELMIDLMVKLQFPVVLVVKNYLGCINHTLLSMTALKNKGLNLEYVVFNGSFPVATEKIIRHHTEKGTKIINIPHMESKTKEKIKIVTNDLKYL
ncbi:MAG: dethiobiotin synthase [Bergeyella sp.]|nr:dethiobiotin synthase [Bergeyella sp.]